MKIGRGFRAGLEEYLDISQPFQVRIRTIGPAVYDSCCFGLDAAEKLSDDRYMVFYNQTSSPGQEITYSAQVNDAKYQIRLNALPDSVVKLVFTLSIDGNGTMGTINSNIIDVIQNGKTVLQLSLIGSDFTSERSIVGIEIYLKSIWRIAAVARGFNFGLDELVKSFGGEIAVEAPRQSVSSPAVETTEEMIPDTLVAEEVIPDAAAAEETVPDAPAVEETVPDAATAEETVPDALAVEETVPDAAAAEEKIPASPGAEEPAALPVMEEAAFTEMLMNRLALPQDKLKLEKHVMNLSACVAGLNKENGIDLGKTKASVVVALDYSRSMGTLYKNGTVQQTINKLMALGLAFDENESAAMFLFQNDFRKLPSLSLSNYENYVQQIILDSDYTMGGTYYAPVLKAIIEGSSFSVGNGFFNSPMTRPISSVEGDGEPTLVLFITDGENFDLNASDAVLRRSSEKKVFIQFIGIGNEAFSYLKQLDAMPGRKRNNTGFSHIQDLASADDGVLYSYLLTQFARWLKALPSSSLC